ncbi:MAG TPA: 2'-5' RNA ligase family protein [Dehalococcoidia bacterium]|nr:2'-5' RNA ligase family protein [Dehalococcoidia bacterium]
MPEAPSEFQAAWARFQATGNPVLVPETLESAWAQGRDRFLAFLVPVDNPAVLSHIRAITDRLRSIPGVEPYPKEYYHITIKGAGFLVAEPSNSDECSQSGMEAAAEQAARSLARQPPFRVDIGLPNGFPEVVFMEVWDGGDVRRLNTALMEGLPNLVRYPFDGPRFLPHISIARFTSDEGLAELKAVLADLRNSAAGPAFTVTHIDLICAHLSAAAPTFELLRRYQLSA